MEFAIVAPVIVTMLAGVFDIGRLYLIRQQMAAAAMAIAQNAEKLSESTTSPTVTSLTSTQMQTAMSTVYAAIPGLALGNGTGSFPDTFSVTLSGVVFSPLCQSSNGCTPSSSLTQTPYTLWSSVLTEGGAELSTASSNFRACTSLTAVSVFPDDSTQLTKMIAPSSIILVPQVVADVSYTYVPIFPFFVSQVTLWASASIPSAVGLTDQEITFNSTSPTGNVVSCTVP